MRDEDKGAGECGFLVRKQYLIRHPMKPKAKKKTTMNCNLD